MKIAVIGLGLIGGSFCKAIKKYTNHECVGMDIDRNVENRAVSQGSIDRAISSEQLADVDISIVCLHPSKTIQFLQDNAKCFKPGAIVMDSCGIKGEIVNQTEKILTDMGVVFIPAHPMAGIEHSGFDYSLPDLFKGASFIATPGANVPDESMLIVERLVKSLGFARVVTTTPDTHDSIIAFTSQLAHIVSSAYIKSPTAAKQAGFSAGSFQDMTRVAKLNEGMWTELFMMNRDNLLFEIQSIIKSLGAYENALRSGDEEGLRQLLKDGRILKEQSLDMQKE